MKEKNRICEAGELNWDECERPATAKVKVDRHDDVWLCDECYSDAAYANWAHWYRSAGR